MLRRRDSSDGSDGSDGSGGSDGSDGSGSDDDDDDDDDDPVAAAARSLFPAEDDPGALRGGLSVRRLGRRRLATY